MTPEQQSLFEEYDEPYETLRLRPTDLDPKHYRVVDKRIERALMVSLISLTLSIILIGLGLWQFLGEEARVTSLIAQRTMERDYRNCVSENYVRDLAAEVHALREHHKTLPGYREVVGDTPIAQPKNPETGELLPPEQDPRCHVNPPLPVDPTTTDGMEEHASSHS